MDNEKKLLLILTSILILLSGCKDKRSVDELFNDTKTKIENKEFSEAKKDVEKLVKLAYGNSDAFQLKGIVESELEDYNSALLNFQKSISLDSTNFKTYVERAKLKIKLGDYKSAISDCNTARFYNKEFYSIYKTKGIAYEFLEDGENAVIQYEHSIKYGDNSGETYYKLGVLYLSQGNNQKGCSNLSKAGELGYMDAYDLIKSNCNKTGNEINSVDDKKFGQFKSYPNRFAITFPIGWDVDEISNSDKSVLTVTASKEGHFMSVLEIDPTITDFNFNSKSVYEIDKEDFLYEFRQKYSDFKLHDFEKKRINGVDTYYFKMSFSFFSTNLQKTLSGIQIMYALLNPKTKKLYYFQGNAEKDDIDVYEPIYRKTFETFKLL